MLLNWSSAVTRKLKGVPAWLLAGALMAKCVGAPAVTVWVSVPIVAERAPEEMVIGVLGKFWTPRGGASADVTAADFAAGPPKGFALAGWNFTVVPRADGLVELRTETRVWCAPDARLKFRAYWLVVRPGSALIRRAMLRAIRREAQSTFQMTSEVR